MARVDILIPCYNYAHFLDACLRSVLTQTGVDLRVTVIDDASTDESATVVERIARSDRRVRLVSLSRNVGMIPAINRGLAEIDGDYLVKLDADDLLAPSALARAAQVLDRFPQVGFVYGRARHFTGAAPRPRGVWPRHKVWPGNDWIKHRFEQSVNCISQPEAMIRTRTLRGVGDYNPALPHTSDLEMWLRLAAVADVGRINGVDQGFYRVHAKSMQRTVHSGPFSDLAGRRDAFLNVLPKLAMTSAEKVELEATVRAKIAASALDHLIWTFDRGHSDPALTQALIDFAKATSASATSLPQWAAAERRRAQGRHSRWAPRALLSTLQRRGAYELASLRLMMTGL